MQPKVSMVIPCYNKVKWVGGMFDSIIAQKWDNIELILVNDGSTDGTREVIAEYEPKFISRGFEVVIVDQENQGVGAAVKNGLMKVTGEYVCIPDADDELDSEYVSAMAGWLWEHPEDEWVVCDVGRYNFDHSCNESRSQALIQKYPYKLLESFIFRRIIRSISCMIFRTSYMNLCRVVEIFCVEPRTTQEPQVLIPLILGGARPIYMQRPLYRYCTREGSTQTTLQTYTEVLDYTEQRTILIEKTLRAAKTLDYYEETLLSIYKVWAHHQIEPLFTEYDEFSVSEKLIEIINGSNIGLDKINKEIFNKSGCKIGMRYIGDKLIGRKDVERKKIERKGNGLIIAYAAFGRAAKRVEIGLVNSDIRPDVYWDIKAKNGDKIRGIPIMRPDFKALKSDDTILMLLLDNHIASTVTQQITDAPVYGDIWYYEDVLDYLVGYYYD